MAEARRIGAPRVEEEYAEAAAHYDRKWRRYIEASARETIRRMPLPPTARVLDVGCGTGALLQALQASHPGAALAGIDPVPQMLEQARSKLGSRADLRVGYAEALPWDAGAFDVVVSCNVFHYIGRPLDALGEMARVLRPGGTVVITDWCDDFVACRVCSLYLRATRRSLHRIYRGAELCALLGEAGFAGARLERYRISWLWGLMTASARLSP